MDEAGGILLGLVRTFEMIGVGLPIRLRTASSDGFVDAGEGAPLCLSFPFFLPDFFPIPND